MHKEKIELINGDITEISADIIVNAANNDLILGGGVAGAVRRKGGLIIQEECNKIGTIPVGNVAITSAGNLNAKWVVHAASMSLGSWTTEQGLINSVKNSMHAAEQKKAEKIAFPAIGTGIAGFPPDKCAKIMLEIFMSYFVENPATSIKKIYIVLYDEKNYTIFKSNYGNIKE